MKFSHVTVCDHPFVQDSLSHLRDRTTKRKKFREHSDRICYLLFAEAIRGLTFKNETIMTPLCETVAPKLADEVIVVPVLRSGIAMLFGAMQLLPKSKIGFVGMARDEETAQANEYYWKLPKITRQSVVIVTDPMLATGGSILHVLRRVAQEKAKEIRVVSVVSAPEGLDAIEKEFPQVKVFTASIDQGLNEHKYIVPGLGDYGDRYFGTD
ncbi:MAG TPA: uracil phosphoribosyltransferase [Candidatus Woesebacteria bacterium]|nr:uracil phosphoribosyltransferase [Candidatus Woesebacteria bacterium]